jgi:predicted ester cyclase
MNAGVVKARLRQASIDRVIEIYRELVLNGYWKVRGARGGELWINRESGELLGIGYYDSPEAVRAFKPIADQAQTRLELYQERAAEYETYELAASTSSATAEVVEAALKAFNSHDAEALARLSAPDIHGAAPGYPPMNGPQDVKEYSETVFRAFPDALVKVENMVVTGGSAMVETAFSATHAGPLKSPMGEIAPTGRRVTGRRAHVLEIDRGLVRAFRTYFDQVELMAQLGVAPAQTTTA